MEQLGHWGHPGDTLLPAQESELACVQDSCGAASLQKEELKSCCGSWAQSWWSKGCCSEVKETLPRPQNWTRKTRRKKSWFFYIGLTVKLGKKIRSK